MFTFFFVAHVLGFIVIDFI